MSNSLPLVIINLFWVLKLEKILKPHNPPFTPNLFPSFPLPAHEMSVSGIPPKNAFKSSSDFKAQIKVHEVFPSPSHHGSHKDLFSSELLHPLGNYLYMGVNRGEWLGYLLRREIIGHIDGFDDGLYKYVTAFHGAKVFWACHVHFTICSYHFPLFKSLYKKMHDIY